VDELFELRDLSLPEIAGRETGVRKLERWRRETTTTEAHKGRSSYGPPRLDEGADKIVGWNSRR